MLTAGVGAYLAAHFPAILAGRNPSRTLPFYPSLAQRFQADAFQGTPGLYCLPGVSIHPLLGAGVFLLFSAALLWWLRRLSRPGSRRVRPGAAAFLAGAAGLLLPFLGPGSLLPGGALRPDPRLCVHGGGSGGGLFCLFGCFVPLPAAPAPVLGCGGAGRRYGGAFAVYDPGRLRKEGPLFPR